MERRPLKRLGAMIGIGLAALILVGCNGSRGQTGATASAVPVISASALSATDWAGLNLTGKVTSVNMNQGKPQVTFTVTNNDASPVAGLSANASSTTLSTGAPLVSYPNFAFTIAKLVPGSGGNSQWVSYIISSTPSSTAAAVPNHPSSDNTGTLTEDGLGNYTYTFYRDITQAAAFLQAASYSAAKNQVQSDLGDVSYQPTLTHRIGISVGGAFRGTGSNTANGTASSTAAVYPNRSTNLIYDFVPATGQVAANAATKVVVDKAACEACHTKLGVSFHTTTGGAMNDPRYCDTCHTDQQKNGQVDAQPASGTAITASGSVKLNGMAVGNMTGFIHRLHMGSNLKLTGYKFAGVLFNNITYPQDVRNCATCHTGSTPQSGNYLTVPSVAACGACHDGVNFATGAGHGPANLPQLSDAACAGCHESGDIAVEHTATQSTSSYYLASNPKNLPTTAAKVHYLSAVISSVTTSIPNGDTTDLGNPVIQFKLYADGDTSNPLPYVTPASITATNMISIPSDPSATFVGAPSLIIAMGIPQNGITPADFNYKLAVPLVAIWNGSSSGTMAGTLSYNNSTGMYTVTVTAFRVPAGVTLMGMGVGDSASATQTNLGALTATSPTSGLTTPSTSFTYNSGTSLGGVMVPLQTTFLCGSFPVTNSGTTNNSTIRRTIVANDACNACHSNLGAFTLTADNFHGANNNDAASCAVCHTTAHSPGNGYSINAKDWVHGIHATGFRNYPYTVFSNFPTITYPGILNNCEACHVAGSYNFGNATNAAQIPNMLWDSISGTMSASAVTTPINTTGAALPISGESTYATWFAPKVTAGEYCGVAFTTTTLTANTPIALKTAADTNYGTTWTPTGSTLVISPITAACASCHDSAANINHMTSGTAGGVYYKTLQSVATATTVGGSTQYTLSSTEACLSCHGSGATEDIAVVHANY